MSAVEQQPATVAPSRALLRLGGLVRGLRGWIALALLLGVATVALNVGLLALASYVIAAAALHPLLITLSLPLALIRLCGVARAFARYGERLVSHDVTLRLLARLRESFYARLEPLVPARLVAFRSGDLLARMVEDVEELEQVYGRVFTPLAVAALTVLLTGAALWSFSPLLAVVAILGLSLAGIGVPLLAARLGRASGRREIALRAELHASLVDGIQGMPDLLAFGRGADQTARLATLDRAVGATRRRLAWAEGLQGALGEALTYGTLALVLALAIPLARADRFGAVYLAAMAMVVLGAFEAITPLGRAFAALGRSLMASQRLFEVIDAAPAVIDSPQPRPLATGPAALAFDHVSFRYAPNEPPVLADISFVVAPGERVAIVGPSGAGKSTILNLALRFWDPVVGAIRYGERDLREVDQEAWRGLIGVAPQDSYVFSDTLRANLLLGRQADEAELLAALDRVGLTGLLRELPRGLDTWVGEHGLRLSGGERQRLNIARALLRAAPLLILDEPTANLDPATEEALLADLYAESERALLVITHRLVRMDAFDVILVLDGGRIVERGTHDELLAQGTRYRDLYEAQQVGGTDLTPPHHPLRWIPGAAPRS